LLSKIIGTSDRFLDSDGNTLYLVLLSLGFLKGNFAGFWGTQERFSFFYPSICLRKKKICGSWQECFCKVVGEHSEQYLSQNWAWEKSFAKPLPALHFCFWAQLLSVSPCSTTQIPLFQVVADLMWHYIKCFSEVQIGWIYNCFSKKVSTGQRHVIPNPPTSLFIVSLALSDRPSEKCQL